MPIKKVLEAVVLIDRDIYILVINRIYADVIKVRFFSVQ